MDYQIGEYQNSPYSFNVAPTSTHFEPGAIVDHYYGKDCITKLHVMLSRISWVPVKSTGFNASAYGLQIPFILLSSSLL